MDAGLSGESVPHHQVMQTANKVIQGYHADNLRLQEENRTLREAYAKLESGDREASLEGLRRELEDLRHEVQQKAATIEELRGELEALRAQRASEATLLANMMVLGTKLQGSLAPSGGAAVASASTGARAKEASRPELADANSEAAGREARLEFSDANSEPELILDRTRRLVDPALGRNWVQLVEKVRAEVPTLLFPLHRTQNGNTVVYHANLDSNGRLVPTEPVASFWIMYEKPGVPAPREGLNAIERNTAYGISSKPGDVPGHFTVKICSIKQRSMDVWQEEDGKVHAATTIAGTPCCDIKCIYIAMHFSYMVPKVDYVDLIGEQVETGDQVHERILP